MIDLARIRDSKRYLFIILFCGSIMNEEVLFRVLLTPCAGISSHP